jgi:hypothetical protein
MDSAPAPAHAHVDPNPLIPRAMGSLNIVLALALMVCGLGPLFWVLLIPVGARNFDKVQKQLEVQEESERKAEAEQFAAEEKAANTDEAKAEVRARRKDAANRPRMSAAFKLDVGSTGLTDRRLRAFVWAEFVSGLALNLLLLASGIGLVMRRLWGLKMALWVAALKPVRLGLVYGYFAVAIVPLVSQGIARFLVQTTAQQQQAMGRPMPPAVTAEKLTRLFSVGFGSGAVAVILLGSVYPAISLWLLSRPGARAACSGAGRAPGTDESW